MKKQRVLAGILAVCLLLAACTRKAPTPGGESEPPAVSSQPTNPTIPTVTRGPSKFEEEIKFRQAGKRTVHYSVNMSIARYIDAPEKLPDYEELKQYDAAWFENRALLLIYETVRSSSVQVDVDRIVVEEGRADITLTHTPKDNAGTTMYTTWLLWLEVDADLDLKWSVVNPAEENETVDR